MPPAPSFDELFAAARTSAVHLEMRDSYTPEDPVYQRWLVGEPIDWAHEYRGWFDLVRTTVARGVAIRRARIVSEPLAPFIRQEFECAGPMNIAAGEQVRWLPRRNASDLALPGNDFWVFDDQLALFLHFAGDGRALEDQDELTESPAIVRHCTSAFEAVWARAIPHEDYQPA